MAEVPVDPTVAGLVSRLDDVTSALDELSKVLDEEEDLATIMDRVCRQVVAAIPGADMASVTVLHAGEPRTVALTGERAAEVDRAQYGAGEGPCLEAARTRVVQRVAVAEVHERWPAFAVAADGLGVASYLSAPLVLEDEYRGSLNLYSERTHGFRELDAALLELYTTAAEAGLRNARRYVRARRQADQLQSALTSRAVIDQAKGIVMAVHQVDAEKAFNLLVDRSQRENLKLRDLAERFVDDVSQTDG
ncbi:GAF and ANTAR domain-containing protein [Saccharothrix longispora]|uniref:GAF domain-containing protein n=1 Tax=Saccharothrix longispora TaxID=33920 RepID=A0ABU1PQP0_9PSEU|nr:GAF and ANTAR domain-containing protein [Saccharothrix longispora]MDR6592950.1 GAF domain-containing protein [Saccharothrix longispora]